MLSSKTQYAVLAMLQLAQDFPSGDPLQANRIAEKHGIPANFLVQILHDLKRAGLVASTRGAAGGYRLTRAPHEITLREVVEVFESSDAPEMCAANRSPMASVLVDVCGVLANTRRDVLEAVSLTELAERAEVGAGPMWYI